MRRILMQHFMGGTIIKTTRWETKAPENNFSI